MGRDFSVYRSEPYFLEIMPKGIDKARSLARLLEVLGLDREQMIACGDGYNDPVSYTHLPTWRKKYSRYVMVCRTVRLNII